MMLGVTVERAEGWTILRVRGEVDMATGPELRQHIVRNIGDGNAHLVVDLEAVDFIDSTGLGVLIGGLKRSRSHGGDLRVAGLSPHLTEVFELTGLGEVLSVVDLSEPSSLMVDVT